MTKKVCPESFGYVQDKLRRRIFLDSSVLVAASASKTGASALILGYCRLKKISGYVSLDTIGEARKNVNLKLKKINKERFIYFLRFSNLILASQPSAEEIAQSEQAVNPKDAPILAAALKSSASFLITLDKKHFLKPKVINFSKPLKIISPGEFVLKHLKR